MPGRTYVGTRASAQRGALLDKASMEKLAESATLEELLNRLKVTPYSEALSNLVPPLTARKLELALRRRLDKAHYDLMKAAGGYRLIQLYYLKHIAWDLKSVLKSKALGKSYEESIEYLDMKAEELVGRRELMVKVLSASDVREGVALLSGTEFHADIERAAASFSATGEARFFDIYVDHAVLTAISEAYSSESKLYSSSRSVDVAGIGEIVAVDVDAYNVVSVLRAKLWGLPSQEVRNLLVTPTFRVPTSVLVRMIGSESVSDAVKQIQQIYPTEVKEQTNDEELIDAVEEVFTTRMKATLTKTFAWQKLGPAYALALIKLLEFEVNNIAAIAVGVEARMSPKDIMNKLGL
ncbi:MAG: V-type ATPase subunit [Nitrososphaerales archaeon]|jgi:V/A-type H+-transporting ATPase subunit C